MSEMLWSDPQPFAGRGPSKRGVGLSFGPDITRKFLDNNGLDMIVRSHEVKDEGYLVEHDGRLVTVFSAPNCKFLPKFLLFDLHFHSLDDCFLFVMLFCAAAAATAAATAADDDDGAILTL